MRRTLAKVTVWGALAAGLAQTMSAQALGLGEINVESLLNQRFSAVIPLSEIESDELETVTVTVAPADAYERAGLERSDYLDSLQFTVRNDGGMPRVAVSSGQIAREPVVNLLVQARWSGGRILREYTVLLDPPPVVRASPPAPKPVPEVAPAAVAAAIPVPVIAAPKPPAPAAPRPPVKPEPEFYETRSEVRAPAPLKSEAPTVAPPVAPPVTAASLPPAMPTAPSAGGTTYGPVQGKETLWSIATKLRPSPDISMDQVILALAVANPRTIQRGTTVNKDARLSVPSADAMRAVSPAEAKARLATLRGGAIASKPPAVAAITPPVTPPKVAAVAKPSAPEPAAAPAPAVKPVKPGRSVLDAPVALTTTPVSKPAPAVVEPPKPAAPPPVAAAPVAPQIETPTAAPTSAAKPEVKPEPKAEAKPELQPEAGSPSESKPEGTPAGSTAAVTAPIEAPPAPAPAVATPPAAESAAAPPAVDQAQPALSQALPEEPAEAGLSDLLSTWGLPIAGLLVLVLGGVAVVRRLGARAGKPGSRPMDSKPDSSTSRSAGLAVAGSAGGSRLGDTQVTPARAPETAPSMEQTQAITQQITQRIDGDAAGEMRPSAFESTLIIEPELAAGLKSAARPTAVGQSKTDFDMTTQLHAETMHISLDNNDPVSEADFHLAYGLYDEAILLLKQAMTQHPTRTDIPAKLAETYFAAGRPMEFQMLAEDLQRRVDASEWNKIAIMGAQLCPGVALFSSIGDAALEADFDLGFDEPAPTSEPVAVAAATPAIDVPLSFDLPDVSIPSVVEFTPPPAAERLDNLDANIRLQIEPELAAPATEEDPASIDFMLGQSITPLGAASDAAPPALDANLLEFDLDHSIVQPVDSSKPLPGMVDDLDFHLAVSPPAPDSMGDSVRDLMLEEFSVSLTPRDMPPGTITDEFNTKLDLARAYVEMGDNEMARGLLQDVQQLGDSKQQREASEMLQRLPA